MANKIDRREFLGAAAQVSCGCIMAAGFMGCAALAHPSRRPEGESVTEASLEEVSVATAYCGIYCAACSRYLSGLEDPSQGCPGCNQGEIRYPCKIKACAVEKSLNACGECDQFVCEQVAQFFGRGRDNSVIGEKNSYRIREIGYAAWLQEQAERWACEKCGTAFSFGDEVCPNCSADILSLAEEAAAYREE